MKGRLTVVGSVLLLVAAVALTGCEQGGSGMGITSSRPKTIEVPADAAWTDAGLDVQTGQVISARATGDAYVGKKLHSGPDGIDNPGLRPVCRLFLRAYNVTSKAPHGALIGRIGKDGKPFLIGSKGDVQADSAGRLFLGINDEDLKNNRGLYTVSLTCCAGPKPGSKKAAAAERAEKVPPKPDVPKSPASHQAPTKPQGAHA